MAAPIDALQCRLREELAFRRCFRDQAHGPICIEHPGGSARGGREVNERAAPPTARVGLFPAGEWVHGRGVHPPDREIATMNRPRLTASLLVILLASVLSL